MEFKRESVVCQILEKNLQRNENVYHVKANLQTGKAFILFDSKKNSEKEILTKVNKDVYYILQRVAPIDVKQ